MLAASRLTERAAPYQRLARFGYSRLCTKSAVSVFPTLPRLLVIVLWSSTLMPARKVPIPHRHRYGMTRNIVARVTRRYCGASSVLWSTASGNVFFRQRSCDLSREYIFQTTVLGCYHRENYYLHVPSESYRQLLPSAIKRD